MKFQPKTDWKYNDTPTEGDFNRIEQGIADAHEGREPIIQQDTPPDGVMEGRLWLDTSDGTYQGTVFETLKGEIDGHLADETKHLKAGEREKWDAKETPEGAQAKADYAEKNAETYTDQKVKQVSDSMPIAIKRDEKGAVEYVLKGQDLRTQSKDVGGFTGRKEFTLIFDEISIDFKQARFLQVNYEAQRVSVGTFYHDANNVEIWELIDEYDNVIATLSNPGVTESWKLFSFPVLRVNYDKVIKIKIRASYVWASNSNNVTSYKFNARNTNVYTSTIEV